jgi:sortase A
MTWLGEIARRARSLMGTNSLGHDQRRAPRMLSLPRSGIMLAVLVLTTGVGLLGYSAYQVWGHEGDVNRHQDALENQWSSEGSDDCATGVCPSTGPTPRPRSTGKPPKNDPGSQPLGSALARVSLPRLGQSWIVVEGVEEADIRYAPGHYPGSANPGAKGNFAVAGHRQPGIFWDLDQLQAGDTIIVETHTKKYTYVVRSVKITSPQSRVEVSPTPPGFNTGDKVLTLTTCNPKWDNYQRLVVHAVIV